MTLMGAVILFLFYVLTAAKFGIKKRNEGFGERTEEIKEEEYKKAA